MKICLVANYYPPEDISGLSRYLFDTANYIAKKGIQVHVVTSSNGEIKVEKQGKVTVHKIPSLNIFLKKGSIERMKEIFSYLDLLIKKEKLSLVSCHDFHTWSYKGGSYAMAAVMAAAVNNIPCTATMHIAFLGDVDGVALRSTPWTKVLCVSRYIGELAHSSNVPIDNLAITYPGTNLKAFRPGLGRGWLRQRLNLSENDFVVLCAARIVNIKEKRIMTEKGIPTLLKAFSIVAEKHDNAELVIAAAKPRDVHMKIFTKVKKKIMEQCQLFGIGDRIRIESFDMDQMPYVYNGADIFVLPTEFEALGLVFVEAMACGIPVIGTAVGGVPEVIQNNENGYLVEVNEPVELAKRMLWLMEDSKKRKVFSRKALKTAREKFDLVERTENLIGVYRSVTSRKGAMRKKGKKKKKNAPEMGILFNESAQAINPASLQ